MKIKDWKEKKEKLELLILRYAECVGTPKALEKRKEIEYFVEDLIKK